MLECKFFFFNDTATTEIYTLSLHDALPIFWTPGGGPTRGPREPRRNRALRDGMPPGGGVRSEEHTSELQSRPHLVCRLLLEKKNTFALQLWFQLDSSFNASNNNQLSYL